jgi:integrase/recombinase XerD
MQNYLGYRQIEPDASLWVTREAKRLSYTGLRDILRRRAARVGVEAPTLHSFRRTFAILCLRRGVDIFSLQRLMGHSDLTVLRRYLAQTQEDLRKAHQKASPADELQH